MATALRNRLSVVFDTHLAPITMARDQSWPDGTMHIQDPTAPAPPPPTMITVIQSVGHAGAHGSFGSTMSDIRTVVVHETDGWPSRNKAPGFVHLYTTLDETTTPPKKSKWGTGPQFYISSDGSSFQIIGDPPFGQPRQTWHTPGGSGIIMNDHCIGVETGHGNGGEFDSNDIAPDHDARWKPASGTPNQEDIPNAQLFVMHHSDNPIPEHDPAVVPLLTELLVCWWATTGYDGPLRETITRPMMIFSEWQYRTWALLARAFAGEYELPRNFPLLPHLAKAGTVDQFKRIVMADETADMQLKNLVTNNSFAATDFDPAHHAQLAHHYGGGNGAWDAMFKLFRGFHGHNYASGNHDCPGPMFDWWRFARSVWDWWWFPFDFAAPPQVGVQLEQREYRPHTPAGGGARVVPHKTTPLLEHYWDADATAPAPPPAPAVQPETPYRGVIVDGILGPTSSPETYAMPANAPVYALANGTLVAAWFPQQQAQDVSFAFALVRHEVFHQPQAFQFPMLLQGLGQVLPQTTVTLPDIDYDLEPTTVFTLYMHLSASGINFQQPDDANPDWLNRVLIRVKECTLGLDFHTRDVAKPHPLVEAATWTTHPPGSGAQRPTLLDGWTNDGQHLGDFVRDLAAGNVAIAFEDTTTSPIRVLLGDFLGNSGNIRVTGNTPQTGVRVEVFSTNLISSTAFTFYKVITAWQPPTGGTLPPALCYKTEWVRDLTQAERTQLTAINANPDLMQRWWTDVATATQADVLAPADGRLPTDGKVFHYSPLDFMHWLNGVTWASEWPKYKITDDPRGRPDHGNAVALPTRPRIRRI